MTETTIAGRNSDTFRDAGNPTTSDRVAGRAHETIDRVAETANQAEQGMRGAATRAAEAARKAQEQLSAAAGENAKKIRSYIEQNPLTTAGIAFAVGVVVSALVVRRG
ncbi:MAG: hypothetical protein ABI640_20490 [Gammaproteobacteria bacterium]